MRRGSDCRPMALALAAFVISPILAVADKTQPKPASRPPMAQAQQNPVVMTAEVVKIPCPRSDFEAGITLRGADAANWKPQLLYSTGQMAKSHERSKGVDGRDELRCFYLVTPGFGTTFRYFVRRPALATHPICKAGGNLFECRALKKGENYATAEY